MAKGDKNANKAGIGDLTGVGSEARAGTGANANRSRYQSDEMFGRYANPNSNEFGEAESGYRNFASGGGDTRFDPAFRSSLDSAIGNYKDFAATGGFSGKDLQDIRARNIAPTRAIYSNMQGKLNQQRRLNPGGSNFAASASKLAREGNYAVNDANVNSNASIAQMVQQGKLAGTGGLASSSLAGQGQQANVDQFNQNMRFAGTQGMSSTARDKLNAELGRGGLALGASGQANQSQSMMNQLALGLLGAQQGNSQMKSNFETGFDRVKQGAGIGGKILGKGN